VTPAACAGRGSGTSSGPRRVTSCGAERLRERCQRTACAVTVPQRFGGVPERVRVASGKAGGGGAPRGVPERGGKGSAWRGGCGPGRPPMGPPAHKYVWRTRATPGIRERHDSARAQLVGSRAATCHPSYAGSAGPAASSSLNAMWMRTTNRVAQLRYRRCPPGEASYPSQRSEVLSSVSFRRTRPRRSSPI